MREDLVIPKIFSNTVSKYGDKVALQIKKGSLWQRFTYHQIEDYSLKVGAFLIKEGFKKGEHAAVILENRPEWGLIYLGIMYAGLTCVPLDPQLSQQEIRNLILDSQAKVIFCTCELFSQKIKQAMEGLLIKVVVLDVESEQDKDCINFSALENLSIDNICWSPVYPEDIASLIYTSGTTGKPKGVMLSHKNICSNFESIQKLSILFPSDNILSILPLHHMYAFMANLIVPLFLGGTVTYCLSLKPQDLSQIIKENKITVLIGVPQFFSLLHKAIFDTLKWVPQILLIFIIPLIKIKVRRYFGRSLRLMVSGGARLEPKVAKDLSSLGFKLIEGYGLTETSPIVTLNPFKKVKFGSVGIPVPDVEIKIFNPDKSGIGEVLIKGPNLMQGYFRQPQLTAQAIKDEWLYSQDLGYVDKDGYLFLVGRQTEIIVLSSGKNIYPEELEAYYLKSPYIKEICIIPRQEKIFGYLKDSLFAVIVPDLEFFKQRKEANIREKVRWNLETLARNLPSYKHIMGFTLTKEGLPRTALRKIKRYQLRQEYLDKKRSSEEIKEVISLDETPEILNKEMAKKIINYISKELNKPVYLDSHLEIDLGIDSLSRVELGLGLEALLKIKIPDELLYSIATIKEIIIKIQALMTESPVLLQKEEALQKSWSQILKEVPPETILKKINIGFGFLEKIPTRIFKNIFLFIFRIFWFLRIEGKENLPSQGPYLICSNHASYLDGLFIFSSLPFKICLETYFLGYQHILEHPLLGWVNKATRLISIDTSIHLSQAMQAVAYVISHQKVVCIFPEGMRSIDANIKEFKKGVGILIKELDIPVIPVYIKGSHQSWPRGSQFPRFYPIKVVFGRALSLKELISTAATRGESSPDNYETIARQLREEVLKLSC